MSEALPDSLEYRGLEVLNFFYLVMGSDVMVRTIRRTRPIGGRRDSGKLAEFSREVRLIRISC